MRVYTYIFIIIGIQMLLFLAGVTTSSGYVLGGLNPFNPQGFNNTLFYSILGGIFALAAFGTYLGFIVRVNPESFIIAGMCTLLVSFIWDILGIIIYYNATYPNVSWMGYIISALLFPIAVGFGLSIISFWRGASD